VEPSADRRGKEIDQMSQHERPLQSRRGGQPREKPAGNLLALQKSSKQKKVVKNGKQTSDTRGKPSVALKENLLRRAKRKLQNVAKAG